LRLLGSVRSNSVELLRRTGYLQRALHLRHRYRATRDEWVRRARLRATPPGVRSAAVGDDVMITTVAEARRRVRAVVARRRDSPKVSDAVLANRDLVVTALRAHGIAHEHIPIDSPNRVRIAVADGARGRLLEILRASTPPTTYVYFDSTTIGARRRVQQLATAPMRRLRALGDAAWIWRIFEYRADASGVDVLGDIHGCELELWGLTEDGERVTPRRWNSALASVDVADFGRGPRAPGIPTRYLATAAFPIDVVYTWVDGDDPRWRARHDLVVGGIDTGKLHDEASNTARYESRDELRYSLRSLEKFTDFVRHVFIVTDDQHPTWLRDDLDGLTVVSHRDIFNDHGALPTFNSHSIESRLHHVPGLSEHYLYLNDDFFFGRRAVATQFFHSSGLAKFFMSRALIPEGEPSARHKPVDSAAMNGRRLVEAAFGVTPTQKFQHAPYPQLRSVHLDLERRFPAEIATTTKSRVRSPTDLALASSLHHHVAYLTGRATQGQLTTQYVDLGGPNLEGRLYELLRQKHVDSFCLNDTDSDTISPERKRELVHEFLEAYFPEKSSFER